MKLTVKDRIAAARKLHERARDMRGRFLIVVSAIECEASRLMDEYFCDANPQLEEPDSSEEPRAVLMSVVETEFSWCWRDCGRVLDDIRELQDFRDKLVDSTIDVSESALARSVEEGVGFVHWKDGEPITADEFDDYCARANIVIGALMKLRRILLCKQNDQRFS